jgi:serine/threonine protein kinase
MPADAKLEKIAREVCAARGLRFGREVGSGAFKFTFHVEAAGTPKALKLYRKAGADARTQREVEAITRCSHQGIARFDLIATWNDGADEYIYSLEEFLAGGTLTELLRRGTLSAVELRTLGGSLIDAVGHIAALDLVHRDLKPDNIMFRTAGGTPVIVDFGLVRDLGKTSITKTWLAHGPGTPYFAPAEQLNNEKSMIDWRADQFALGVVLAIAGFGAHPYAEKGLSPVQIVERVAAREKPSADFIAYAKGNGLDTLVRMVAPWPVARYRTPALLERAWKTGGTR